MPWSGGTFSRVHDWTTDAAAAINIEADRMDAEDDNFRDGINDTLHRSGQNTAAANLPMGGNRHTAVGNAVSRDDYASAQDVVDQDLIYFVDTGAADAYVITPVPAITAYEEGQRFVFRALATNTGATTINVNALGTRAILTPDLVALLAGAIEVASYYEVTYDALGSRFIMTSPDSITKVPPTRDLIAGTGMTGGGTLAADRTFDVIGGDGITANANDIALSASVAGAGMTHTTGVLNVIAGTGMTVNADDIQLDTTHVRNIDHATVAVTAGAGLSGGGNIDATRTIDMNLTALAQIDATNLDAAREFVVANGATNEALRIQDFGVPQTNDTTTTTLSGVDLTFANRIYNCDNAAAIAAVIPANASVAFPIGTVLGFYQQGAGQVTVSVTTDTLEAPNGALTANQFSTVYARKRAATVWALSGDTSV